jgi:hypothetical protein
VAAQQAAVAFDVVIQGNDEAHGFLPPKMWADSHETGHKHSQDRRKQPFIIPFLRHFVNALAKCCNKTLTYPVFFGTL